MRAGIYVHIPFCAAKCRYCSFNSIPYEKDTAAGYVRALIAEIAACNLRIEPTSLYIGGGTPSILPSESLFAILDRIHEKFPGLSGLECTVEANPGTLQGLDIKGLAQRGVNRASLGAQSFRPSELVMLGRLHGPDEVGLALTTLRASGIGNVNVDLMYSLPGQDLEGWRGNIGQAVALGVQHVSIYDLSLEEETPLYAEVRAGRLVMPPEPLQVEMYLLAVEMLEKAGLVRYEISNFARPGFESAHNMNYWDAGDYVGFGAGAHSHVSGTRYRNVKNVPEYIKACLEGRLPIDSSETLTEGQRISEYMMLGLRKAEGVSLAGFHERFGHGLMELFGARVERVVRSGHAELHGGRLRLTLKGVLASNSVMSEFF